MLIKTSGVIFEITVQGWDGNQWSPNLADELLTDDWLLAHQSDREGYTLTQAEFAEFVALVKSDAESYNAGGNAGEWLIRGDHAPAEIAVSVAKVCADEDSADAKATIWQVQVLSAKAPAHKKDWHNGMVTDADDAHVVKSLSPIAWFLSREDALAELSKYDSYVDVYGTAHEYQIEGYLAVDLTDDGTWDFTGDLYVREYPYVKVYAESPYYGLRFVQLFENLDEAEEEVASSWGGEPWTANLEDSENVLHFKNLDGETVKTEAVQREKEV